MTLENSPLLKDKSPEKNLSILQEKIERLEEESWARLLKEEEDKDQWRSLAENDK